MNLAKSLTLGASITIPLLYALIARGQPSNPNNPAQRLYVGVEIGVSNYNVAIGEPIFNNKGGVVDFNILKRKSGVTDEDPEKTLREIFSFIQQSYKQSAILLKHEPNLYEYIGISCFGPLCLDSSSPLYGTIKSAEREQWRGVQLLHRVQQSFPSIRVGIEYEAKALAYVEFKLGKHQVQHSLAYISVGAGVGVGLVTRQRAVQGLTHSQAGHLIVQRSPDEFESFSGVCKYHRGRGCLQGMVSSRAIGERLGMDSAELVDIADDSIIWRIIAFYLAQLCLSITLMVSPEIIVIGGGVMNRKVVLQLVQEQFLRLNEGHIEHRLLRKDLISQYIVGSRLGADGGVKGAMITEQSNKQS